MSENRGGRPDRPRGGGLRRGRPSGPPSGGRGERRGRPGEHRDRRPSRDDREREPRDARDSREPRELLGPPVPEGVGPELLPRAVRAELKGLSKERAERVGGHLAAAGILVEEDPAAALQHAEAARTLAARLPVVREAVAEVAYAAEEWALALRELRAVRRMTGENDLLPMIADCERALGRPDDALEVCAEARGVDVSPATALELLLVEVGAREDRGQNAEAQRLLRAEVTRLSAPAARRGLPPVSWARLNIALAERLRAAGDELGAERRLRVAAEADPESQAAVDLDGFSLTFDDTELDDTELDDTELDDTELDDTALDTAPEVADPEDGEVRES